MAHRPDLSAVARLYHVDRLLPAAQPARRRADPGFGKQIGRSLFALSAIGSV
jgi:hypothetical protein